MKTIYVSVSRSLLVLTLSVSSIFSLQSQCGFEIYGGIGDSEIEISPLPSSADSLAIVNFLGGNYESTDDGFSFGDITFYLLSGATFEEIQGVRAILCPADMCGFNVNFTPGGTCGGGMGISVEINPEPTPEVYQSILDLYPGNVTTENSWSSGIAYIEWDFILTAQQQAMVTAIICATGEPIPTMNQWGILILGISLLIIGYVAIRQRKHIVAFFF